MELRMIYIDADDNARKTGIVLAGLTPEDANSRMSRYKLDHGVSTEEAEYLIDQYSDSGDLIDTIAISANGFEQITGQKSNPDAHVKFDEELWARVFRPTRGADQ